jgi:deferrochelatase/peroxidase EfeB
MQGGIYWDKGASPPRCYAIAFFKADGSASAEGIDAALRALVECWRGLKEGVAPSLQEVRTPASDFDWLLGFGKKAFDIEGATKKLPRNLRPPLVFNSVDPAGGGLAADGSGLRYAQTVASNVATEEFCAQFTGATPLSVARGIAESAMLLEAMRDPTTGKAPLLMSAAFTGFNREDHRSWLGFHDGISNLISGDERKSVITIRKAGLPQSDGRRNLHGVHAAGRRYEALAWTERGGAGTVGRSHKS